MSKAIRHIAQDLGRAGFRVFPCTFEKRPACPHGFKDASADPDEIAVLWQTHPGPLIGIATGAASGIDVLDVDRAGLAWWDEHQPCLPHTFTCRTRSGGLHAWFVHAAGVGNSCGRVAPGVDVRGDGGYAIYWHATGLPALCSDPPSVWPEWLLRKALPPPLPVRPAGPMLGESDDLTGLLRAVETAREGNRNSILYWAACRCADKIMAGVLTEAEAERWLTAAALWAGLSPREATATIRSGLRLRP